MAPPVPAPNSAATSHCAWLTYRAVLAQELVEHVIRVLVCPPVFNNTLSAGSMHHSHSRRCYPDKMRVRQIALRIV